MTYGGREAFAGAPACVSVFVFVLIYIEFEFPPTPQPRSQGVKKQSRKKAKCGYKESSGHDDQFCSKIIKIGAILGYFWPI